MTASGTARGAPPLRPTGGPAVVPWRIVLLVVLAALAARAPSLGNGFVNYDDAEVRREAATKGPLEILTGGFYYAYKPVYGLSLWLDHVLFGDAAWGWHLGNVLLFACAAGALALVVHGTLGSTFLAAAAGLLVAVHPVHTENVAWVAERKDALSQLLALLAHLSFRRARARAPGRPATSAAVLLLLAGLSKGTLWTYAGVLAIDEALAPRAAGRALRLVPVLAVGALGVALDAWIGIAAGPGAVHHDATLPELAATMAAVHARYALSLVAPVGLSVDYPIDPARGSFADPLAVAGLLLALAAVVGLVLGIRRRSPLLAFACGFWVLGLAPVNNLWPATAILRADRYLLVPAIGAFLLAGAALARLGRARWGALAGAAVLLGALAVARAPVWADSQALWSDALAKEPGSAVAWVNRAGDAAERGVWPQAEADAAKGIEAARALRRPELALRGSLVRSFALLNAGRLDEALEEANAAIALAEGFHRNPWVHEDPSAILAAAHSARGQALTERARVAEDLGARARDLGHAREAFRRAAAIDPTAGDAWFNLGNVLASSGGDAEVDEAIDALRKAVAIRPDHVDAIVLLVSALYKRGRDPEAALEYDRAVDRLGSRRELRLLKARLLAQTGDPAEAEGLLARLVAESPRDAAARAMLLQVRKRLGSEALVEARRTRDRKTVAKALAHFEKAVEVAPEDSDAVLSAGDALVLLGRFGEARARYAAAAALRPDQAWIRNHVARAGALEAAAHHQAGRDAEAAAAMARVVRAAPPRLDLGFASLDAEIARLVPAADAVEAKDAPEGGLAAQVLVGGALLVCGDEDGARDAATRAVGMLGGRAEPGSRLEAVESSALLLRALIRARRADLAGARADLAAVLRRRGDDPLARYHGLVLDRTETVARRRIAEGGGEEAEVRRARAAAAEVFERAQAFADAETSWPGPGLLVAEMAMERGEWFTALDRLSRLGERFPQAASVVRGTAAVYQAQALAGGDRRTLLTQALAALQRAQALDPRDPRTALDLSQLHRLAGNLEAAAKFAMAAASVEPLPGPASRALAAILVERARREHEAGRPKEAKALSDTARLYDPGSAGPDLLEGDLAMRRDDLDAALKSYRAALEKEPARADVEAALASVLRKRGAAYQFWRAKYPRPTAKDGVPPDPAAVADWDRKEPLARAQAMRELEEALRLEPAGEGADEAWRLLESLRLLDDEARRRAIAAADVLVGEANDLYRGGRRHEALVRYREATDLFPDHLPAWWSVARTAFEIGAEKDVETLVALDRLEEIDPDAETRPYALLRGRLWARKAEGDPEAAGRARKALERYLDSPAAKAEAAAEDAALARSLLDRLPKGR